MPFKIKKKFNTYIDRIQLKYDGGDMVCTGNLIKIYDSPFEEVKRSDYGKVEDLFPKEKARKERIVHSYRKNWPPKCIRVLAGKNRMNFKLSLLTALVKEKQLCL